MEIHYKQLQTFVQVAETGSFRLASSHIHRSFSVVSAQIKQLETQLGVKLFERTTRSVRLTVAGELLKKAAQNGFREIEAGLQEIQEIMDIRKGRIAVASSPIMAGTLLPPLLAAFEAHYPAIRILVRELTPAQIYQSVRQGESDFGIGPAHDEDTGFSFEPILSEEVMALVPRKFKSGTAQTITLRELSRMPVLQLSQATALRAVLDQAVKKAGIALEPKYECSQAQTLIAMAHAELGAAILPQSILATQQAAHVQALRITAPRLKREIGLITLTDRPLRPAAARLSELARSHFLKKPTSKIVRKQGTRP